MADWLAMGGYAEFVWTAWGATALVLVALTIWIVRDHAKAKAAMQKSAP